MHAIVLALVLAAPPVDVPGALADAVREARAAASRPPVERLASLDAVAATLAREAASLPESRRFEPRATIEEALRAAGIHGFLRAWQYLAWQGGYDDEAAAAVANWKTYEPGWEQALDAAWRQAGFAIARARDGTVVVVAVFVEPSPALPSVEELEWRVFEGLNRERTARGLAPLVHDPALAAVARAHSRDMLERGYFAHRAPEGTSTATRVREAGIVYRSVAENLAQNVRAADPAGEAVKQWMTSPGHRENVLSPIFTRTGIGVAVDVEERRLTFTQLFLLPPGTDPE